MSYERAQIAAQRKNPLAPPAMWACAPDARLIPTADGGALQTWVNRAGTPSFVQTTAAQKPLWWQSIDSFPALQCDGSNDYMNAASASRTGATGMTLMAACRVESFANSPVLLCWPSTVFELRFDTAGKPSFLSNGISTPTAAVAALTTGTWHVLTGRFDDANDLAVLRVDGTQVASVADTTAMPTSAASLIVGSKGGGSNFAAAYFREVRASLIPRSDADLLRIERAIGAAYGITVA